MFQTTDQITSTVLARVITVVGTIYRMYNPIDNQFKLINGHNCINDGAKQNCQPNTQNFQIYPPFKRSPSSNHHSTRVYWALLNEHSIDPGNSS